MDNIIIVLIIIWVVIGFISTIFLHIRDYAADLYITSALDLIKSIFLVLGGGITLFGLCFDLFFDFIEWLENKKLR